MRRLIGLLFLAVASIQAQVTAITNVSVVDPAASSVRSGKTVVVEGKQIRAVQDASAVIPRGARRVDGSGKYLMPGLRDSHVHLTKAGAGSLPLFIANGVTSVRDMGSDLAEVSGWRKRIEAGELVGPRIATAGKILESSDHVDRMKKEGTVEPVERIRMPLGNPEEARLAVQKLKAGGADHVKMRSTPDIATFEAAAAEAKRLGMPFTMHPIVSLEEMMRAGVSTVEHFAAFPPLDRLPPPERKSLFKRVAQSGLTLSTTLINIDGSIAIPYEEAKGRLEDRTGRLDVRRKYVCGYLVEDWREQVEERKGGVYDEYLKQMPGFYRDVREMREAGVKVIAGTDVGVVFMYPGFSLHDELAKLVEHASFSPAEALRAGSAGSVAPGQPADLVLLDENPLSDIKNTARIRGVMAQGQWFDRKKLDGLLSQAARACSQ